jgi:type I site-specific restriction-modification system R (restriction) subunit
VAQFKPALGMNPELQARYAANRLRVIRQVRYSVHNENSLDLVLFLNGCPVGHGGTEDRLHPEGRGRRRPVPV